MIELVNHKTPQDLASATGHDIRYFLSRDTEGVTVHGPIWDQEKPEEKGDLNWIVNENEDTELVLKKNKETAKILDSFFDMLQDFEAVPLVLVLAI